MHGIKHAWNQSFCQIIDWQGCALQMPEACASSLTCGAAADGDCLSRGKIHHHPAVYRSACALPLRACTQRTCCNACTHSHHQHTSLPAHRAQGLTCKACSISLKIPSRLGYNSSLTGQAVFIIWQHAYLCLCPTRKHL